MAKLWDWMGGSGKRARQLAANRAAVEDAQRALLPFAGVLDGALRAELAQAERDWRQACATAQREDDASQAEALAGFSRIAERLAALRQRAVVERPELAAGELVARAADTLPAIENRAQRCAAALELLGAAVAINARAAFERVLAGERETLVERASLEQLVELVRRLDQAQQWLGAAQGLADCRARAVQRVHGWAASDPEREGWMLALLEVEAAREDLAGARAALAELEGDAREQGLQVLAEALARHGAFEEARAMLASIRVAQMRQQVELALVDALAESGRIDEALLTARRTADGEAHGKGLAKIAGILAGRGELEAALALVAEAPEGSKDTVRFDVFEAHLDREDFDAAERMLETLTDDELRSSAAGSLSVALAFGGDIAYAHRFAQTIEDPFQCARNLETLAWRRLAERDADGARALFAEALEIAGEVARAQSRTPKASGRVNSAWMILASGIQAALGDPRPALECVKLFDDPSQRTLGLLEIGRSCGRTADLAAVDQLVAELDAPFDRCCILSGAVLGLLMLVRPRGGESGRR